MGKPRGTKARAGPKPKEAKTQRERFIETARAIGVDETGAEFEQALAKIVPPRRKMAPPNQV